MSDLYTSLVRAKQELNGGVPPLTPLTEEAKKYMDPDLVPGMGILNEDDDKGLQCPVEGCGKWYSRLDAHLRSHVDDLDVQENGDRWGDTTQAMVSRKFKRLLSIDPSASLCSHKHIALKSEQLKRTNRMKKRDAILEYALEEIDDKLTDDERDLIASAEKGYGDYTEGETIGDKIEKLIPVYKGVLRSHGIDDDTLDMIEREWEEREARKKRSKTEKLDDEDNEKLRRAVKKRTQTMRDKEARERALSAGFRNLFNLCDKQIAQRVLAVRDKVRRWPGVKDVSHHDPQLLGAMALLEWEWDHVIAWVQLKTGEVEDGGRREVAMLVRAWADVHERLPREKDARANGEPPLLPRKKDLLSAMDAETWRGAVGKVYWRPEEGPTDTEEAREPVAA